MIYKEKQKKKIIEQKLMEIKDGLKEIDN